MKSSFCIDLQRFMLIPTKFPLSPISTKIHSHLDIAIAALCSKFPSVVNYVNKLLFHFRTDFDGFIEQRGKK